MTTYDFPDQDSLNALHAAQDLAWDAMDEPSISKKIKLANQAIKISPLCADAFTVLGNNSQSLDRAIDFYSKGMKAGKKALGPDFEALKGHFWNVLDTRPYMRARAELARALWQQGIRQDAIEHFLALIKLNPRDSQGLRYELANWLLTDHQFEALHKLINEYRYDPDVTWPFTKALLEYVEHGQSPNFFIFLDTAIQYNQFIPAYLINPKLLPKKMPNYFTLGGEDQALIYVNGNLNLWLKYPAALEALKKAKIHFENAAKKPPRQNQQRVNLWAKTAQNPIGSQYSNVIDFLAFKKLQKKKK